MSSVHDVAAYILSKHSPMSSMKLQKLVYYSQAWHLVWAETPLFPEKIEAWANGPVVYEIFDQHRRRFTVDSPWLEGDPGNLSAQERWTIDAVLDDYGTLTGRQLSYLTHQEAPWVDARGDLPPTARSSAEITQDALAEYYGAVDMAEDATPVDEMSWAEWNGDGFIDTTVY